MDYYIQDTRTVCGNSVMWWRESGRGYTTDLKEAWKVPATWKGRETDKLWPCSTIDKLATLQLDVQLLTKFSNAVAAIEKEVCESEDRRGPDRDEWKHEAAAAQRLK
jgi:hypothetical protein